MRIGWVGSFVAVVLAPSLGRCQDGLPRLPDPQVQAQPQPPPVAELDASTGAVGGANPAPATLADDGPLSWWGWRDRQAGPKLWGSAEYLLWHISNGPNPTPLVTTGPITTSVPAGKLGEAGTRVLFGAGDLNYGALSGGRITVGGWLDNSHTIGMEASGFLLAWGADHFNAASDIHGNPVLSVPILIPGFGEQAISISEPGTALSALAVGSVAATSLSRSWGSNVDGVFNLDRRAGRTIDLLAGFAYRDLQESLAIISANAIPVAGLGTFKATNLDSFATRNQFYGGQLGCRIGWQRGSWLLAGTAVVDLGETHEVVVIDGSSSINSPIGGSKTFARGLLAQQTNIGRQVHNAFTAIPELQLKLGYDVNSWLRLIVGYDALEWSNVVRPGDQIDHTVNLGRGGTNSFIGFAPPATTGNPLPRFEATGLWLYGVSFGMQLRF